MKRRRWAPTLVKGSSAPLLLGLLAASSALVGENPPRLSPPPTKRIDAEDDYFGMKVVDPYRWLEDDSSPEVQAWIGAQQAYTREVLGSIRGRTAIEKRVSELLNVDWVGLPIVREGRYFFEKRDRDQPQHVISMRRGVNGPEEILIDPRVKNPGGTVSVHLKAVSNDGTLIAYDEQLGGEDQTIVRFFEVNRHRHLPDSLPKDYYWGGIVIKPDKGGFYYARFGNEGPRVLYHQMGTDLSRDTLIFGEGLSRKSTITLSSDDGMYLVINVGHGWSRNDLYLYDVARGGSPATVVQGLDATFSAQVAGNHLVIHTNQNAPNGRIVRADLRRLTRESWKEILPESKSVITGFSVAGQRILVQVLEDAVPFFKIFTLEGRPAGEIRFAEPGSLSKAYGRWSSDEVFISFQSFLVPLRLYRYEVSTQQRDLWWQVAVPFDASSMEVKQFWYISKDGTRAPLFIAYHKGVQLNGSNPTMLHGYGGFNVCMSPSFSVRTAFWLEKGGVYALAILRGGGEFGEKWHRAGMLANKQNVFDDFLAAAEWLIKAGYTSPSRLVINGVSNGGLLVGAAMTQRPDLFRAVICRMPDLDMLRRHLRTRNLYATQEYGIADDPEQFKFLYSYSPYHHVTRGRKYPAVYLTSGSADERVDPFQARKMTAMLQWATASDQPVVLSYGKNVGHSGGLALDAEIAELTDELSFTFWQLGMTN